MLKSSFSTNVFIFICIACGTNLCTWDAMFLGTVYKVIL
jgi:hypothetical protein